jgi:tripartite-type tricarboxylate transporter receptor subunit TctC
MGAHLEKALGQPVIVENLPGASGSEAYQELVSSDPDGHTLALVAAPSAVVTPMIQDVPYDAASFVPIGVITEVPSVLAVGGDSEFRDATAFLDAARQRPGQLTVGVPGATTSQAIELRRLASDYGVQVTSVPFNGNAELIQAVLGGSVDAVLINASADIRAQIDAGAFRPLAISPAERVAYLPDVPTLAELGFPELTYSTSLFGLGAPAGTPPEIVSRLETAMRDGLADPAVRQRLDEAYVPDEFIGADAFRGRLDEIVRVYGPVAQQLKDG